MNRIVVVFFWGLVSLFLVLIGDDACGRDPDWVPYEIEWARSHESSIDMSGYLDAPAGKHGFVGVTGEHLK